MLSCGYRVKESDMSRSFKKTAGWTYESSIHINFEKKQANKKVRRSADISDGRAYKKLFDTWNIRDTNHRYYSSKQVRRYVKKYGGKKYKLYMK
jgi:hypothetical protein